MGILKAKNTFIHLWFLALCFSSCNGQATSKQTNLSLPEPLTFTSKRAKLIKEKSTDQFQIAGCSLTDRSGNVWFGTTGQGVYKYDGKLFTQYTKKDGLCSNGIYFILQDRSGNIWFGSKEAISCFDGKKFTNTTIPGSFISNLLHNAYNNNPSEKNELWSMMQDRSGKFWLGTTDGIYCFDGKQFTRFLDDKNILNTSNLSLKWTQCIFEDKAGNIWFGSWVLANEGISCFNGRTITQYKPYGEGWIRGFLEDKNGALLAVTRHRGVCRFDGKNFINFTEKEGPQNASVNNAMADKVGNLWFGTELGSGELNEDGGLWLYDGKTYTRFTRKNGLCHNGVFSMVEDVQGNIWIGTRNMGLCRYDGKTFTSFSE